MERDREAQREYQREAQLARAAADRRLHPTVPEQQMMSVLERHSSNQHWRKNPVILSGSATSAGISHASLTLKTVGMADLLDGVKSDANRTFDYLNGALAELGERYRIDYQREHEIRDANDRLLTHVDFAWPRDHLAVEVYGPPHYEPFGDPKGDRAEKDARRIQTINSAGWEVLIVYDYEITRDIWIDMVDKVQAFLQEGRGRWPGQEGE